MDFKWFDCFYYRQLHFARTEDENQMHENEIAVSLVVRIKEECELASSEVLMGNAWCFIASV